MAAGIPRKDDRVTTNFKGITELLDEAAEIVQDDAWLQKYNQLRQNKPCEYCGGTLPLSVQSRRFCSEACRNNHFRMRQAETRLA
jgi:predicted nucleic acid-binding Zn ribbon protein